MEDSFGSKKVIAMVDVFCERFSEDDIKKWVKAGGIPTRLRDSLRKSDLWPYIASPALGGLDVGLVDRAAIVERCMRNTGAMMDILINHSTAIAFNCKSLFFQFIKITAYRLFRNLIQLAQFTYHHPLLYLQFLKNLISSL